MSTEATAKTEKISRRIHTKKRRTRVHVIYGDGKSEDLYFANGEHHKLVKQAAKRAGLSMNSWLVQATLKQARAELA